LSSAIFKEAKKLEKDLAPDAAFHRSRSIDALGQCVTKVDGLATSLELFEELKFDLDIVKKAIVQQRKPPTMQSKPSLNVDDLDCI